MEALQEALDLRLDFIAHAHFCHLTNPLVLVLFVDKYSASSGDQLLHLVHTKLVTNVRKVEFVGDWVGAVILHRTMKLVVLLLKVVQL